jgi:hypothetical protein
MKDRLTAAAAVLGVAIIICALLVTGTWRGNRKANQTIEVTGSAKKEIVSDYAIMRCGLKGEGATAEAAYRDLERQKPILVSYFESKGFPADQVKILPPNTFSVDEYTSQGQPTGRVLKVVYNQVFQVETADVQKVEAMGLEISSLVEKGVSLELQTPEYHVTKLAELKIEIQALAAKDAAERALRIAEASGAKLGTIRKASMGVLQITPLHSGEVSDYGVNDLSSIQKEITAVVRASFAIQ